MNINTLIIKNFLAIGGKCPPLNLCERGLVLIEGPNGAGKSSIVDALSWCLFNATARGETGDSVINNKAKKNCEVVVELDDGGQLYRVSRYRKHKVHKNAVRVEKFGADGWADITLATDKDTQGLIEEILGCSREVFVAAIYAGQEATPDLPNMTDKALKAIIEEAAGINRFEQAYELARDELNDVKREMDVVQSSKEANVTSLRSDERSLESIKAEVDEFEKGRATRKAEALREAETLKITITTLGAQYKAINVDELNDKLQECSLALEGAKPAQQAYQDAQKALHNAQIRLSNVTNSLRQHAEQAKRTQEQVKNAPEEMKKPCPECGKPHTEEELGEYVAHATTRLKAQLEQVRVKREEHAQIANEVVALEEGVAVAQRAIPDVSEVSAEYSRISALLRQAGDMKATLGSHMTRYKGMVAQAETFMTEANPGTTALEMLEKRIAKTLENISKADVATGALEAKLEVAKCVAQVFSPAGVRAQILDTVTPFLNERTQDYLSIMSDGEINAVWSTLGETAKGEVREKFNIAVSHINGGGTFGLLSGGEKRRTRLATVMALQDLQASRAVKPINLFIGDEIDQALDVAGLERLMVVLERRAREKGTVLVISHHDLRDWIDTVATMTKEADGSYAEGALVA